MQYFKFTKLVSRVSIELFTLLLFCSVLFCSVMLCSVLPLVSVLTIVQATRADFKHNSSECGKSMNCCIIVIQAMENIFSYGPNLKTEIGRSCYR